MPIRRPCCLGDAVALADSDQPNAYYATLPDADKPGLATLLPTSSGSGLFVVEDNGNVLSVASGSAPALAGFGQLALGIRSVSRLILGDPVAQQHDETLHDVSKRTFLSNSDEKYFALLAALAISMPASERARTMKRTESLHRTATSRTLWR